MCFMEVQISLGIEIEKSNKQNKGKCHIKKNGTQIKGNKGRGQREKNVFFRALPE